MNRSLIIALCLLLTLYPVCFAQSLEQRLSINSATVNTKEFPNIFNPIGRFFKRLFRKEKPPKEYPMPTVLSVTLSQNQTILVYSTSSSKETKGCFTNGTFIEVLTKANEEEKGIGSFAYRYTVSEGKIIGEGSKVFWDLTGAKVGNYKIMAEVDDGCGFCETFVTTEICVSK